MTMSLDELLNAYRQVAQAHELPEMHLAQVAVRPLAIPADALDPTEGAKRLEQCIADFAPTSGWFCYQSAVVDFAQGELPRPEGRYGLILSAEMVNADEESLHIRPDGCGGWRLVRFVPDQGDRYLADEQPLIVHEGDPKRRRHPRRLRYLRYWTPDPHHGMRQMAARFIGFKGGN